MNDDILKKAEEIVNEIVDIAKEKTSDAALITKTVDY